MTQNTTSPRIYTNLIADVASGAKELVAAHAEQMGHEVKTEADRVTSVAGLYSAAGTLMGLGFVFAVSAIAQLLQDRYGFTQTAALGITGTITFACGLACLAFGRNMLQTIRWIPTRSLASLQESLSWISRK